MLRFSVSEIDDAKQHVWPEGHWNWPIEISHKHGVRCGNMIWVGGQVDLSPEGVVLNRGDLNKQTQAVIKNIASVLSEFGCDLTDLVNLNCFYVNDGTRNETTFQHQVSRRLPADSRLIFR
jgi:enamine deaminase RidA (YjgF/YER057c/UK114 family)